MLSSAAGPTWLWFCRDRGCGTTASSAWTLIFFCFLCLFSSLTSPPVCVRPSPHL